MGEVIGFSPRERRTEPARPAAATDASRKARSGGNREPDPEPLWREAVGRELRAERHRQERTLADVASRAGVSTQYLSEVERGLKEPSSEILAAVTGALCLRLVDLTGQLTRSLATRPTGPLALAL